MNTEIQDAWNLGWKLALVLSGKADPRLLDSYEAERWPVGRALLRYTDRISSVFTRSLSTSAVTAWIRRTVVAPLLPHVLRAEPVRAYAFRFVSELGIRYRTSPVVVEGAPALRADPCARDRQDSQPHVAPSWPLPSGDAATAVVWPPADSALAMDVPRSDAQFIIDPPDPTRRRREVSRIHYSRGTKP